MRIFVWVGSRDGRGRRAGGRGESTCLRTPPYRNHDGEPYREAQEGLERRLRSTHFRSQKREIANPGATITDSLQNKPGISGTTFAPGANRPIIRGLDSYRVRIQENGIGTHDVSAISEDHAIPIDPSDADKIEVVRGPSTLRYGSQAIGGVVSVENQRIPTTLPEQDFSGMIKGGGNTVDDGAGGRRTTCVRWQF